MPNTDPIIFYDIPANTEYIPSKAWSPNPWKARFFLNYKGIPYKTEWVEYPDIEGTFKKLEIPPSSIRPDGSRYYSCPAIFDPATGARVSESAQIAEYLDKQYPGTPKLFPDGTHTLQHAFYSVFEDKMFAMFPLCIPKSIDKMNPASQPYLHQTREKFFGKTMKELYPVGEARVQVWAKVKAAFDAVDMWYEKGKGDGPYLLGKEPGFADFVVAAWVISIKFVFGEDSMEWQDVRGWHGGRWSSILDGFQEYQSVH